ncbi:LysR family transcriptional regulator [Lutimaribacter marinistellae]|uniref:LysR family transcriptional regulator n=1 Tax=Lutimaribacter marinistellae TaxID=1820329 RepID=A0ABV7TAG0_9RHOB
MNWQGIRFDWNHARAFLATAEEGSLSAGARALGVTQPTLGRQVAALEAELGVTLFERVGKGLILTPAGAELLTHVRAMRDAATHLSLSAAGQSQDIGGTIRITASEVMCTHVLPPVLLRLREVAPRLMLDIVAADDLRDLQRREADIAIRHARPTQPELIARMLKDGSAQLYAATSYLDRRGRPRTEADLSGHDFISFGDVDRMIGFLAEVGLPLKRENFPVGSESGVAAWALVEAGLGISLMSDHVARASRGIERVLPERAPISFPVWLVTHRELHTARRIRVVFDLLAEFLSSEMV